MTVRVYSDQAGTTAATANDNIGKVEDLSKFDSDGVSSTTGPYLSVDANGFGSADILAGGGDVVQTFTNAISDGSALVVGTSKCIFFSNINVAAGGTLTIGPAGDMINTNGLNLIGKVVSVATTTKVLTTAEQNSIATFFAERGASSVIVNDQTAYDVNSVEADLVLDFTGDSFYRNVPHYFKLGGTYSTFADAFTGTSPKLTYSTAAGSNSTMVNSEGKIVWAPHNLALNSATPATQTITVTSGADYTVRVTGTGSMALSGAGTGTATDGSPATITASTTSLTITLIGSLDTVAVYRSDLGGMHPVPGAVGDFQYYVLTNGNAEYLPRVGHHVYNGSTWVNEGLLIESEARTNLLLNSATLSTQSVTVAAAAHTLSFTGTGTITLSGVSTDGPLVGTGTGEGNRVSLTFTPTAGSLTLTVSGTVSNAQLEQGATPSSYMPTSGGTYTRTAQSLTVPPAQFGWPTPEYIGPELVTASPDLIDGDWTNNGDGSYSRDGTQTSTTNVTFNNAFSANKTYIITAQVTGRTQGQWWVYFGGVGNATGGQVSTNGSHTYYFTPTAAGLGSIFLSGDDLFDGTLDISVREINPLSVSIQMDGRMTYADEDVSSSAMYYRWQSTSGDFIKPYIDTTVADGYTVINQQANSVFDFKSVQYPGPGILTPFNISSRHGSTFINGAVDGVALTADTTPTALPDLSGTDLAIAYDFMGTIGTFRQFAGDIGDDGLEEATS